MAKKDIEDEILELTGRVEALEAIPASDLTVTHERIAGLEKRLADLEKDAKNFRR